MARRLLFLFLIFTIRNANAQPYDLILKGGYVFDAKNGIASVLDVAVANGKIARVEKRIPALGAKKIIDVSGLIVAPGLIDLHTHVFVGSRAGTFADGVFSLSPDDFTFRSGVTTVVDAGTSGWRNFPLFKEQVMDKAQTRILAFLNIAGSGMTGNPQQQDMSDMNVDSTSSMINKHPGEIVGVKIGHYEAGDWTPFDKALEAAGNSKVPLFVECHLPKYSLQSQLARMRPGDIITHTFEQVSERTPIVDEQGKLRQWVLAAQNKGVHFDVGHGGAGFWFSQALPAYRQGLVPNSFGTDLHRFSMNSGMKDMLNVMSKFLNIGMPLQDIIFRATWNTAQSIGRDDIGHLTPGAVADIAVLRVRQGEFGFLDSGGKRMKGKRKLEAELTIRAGKVVWDLNGIAGTE